MEKKILVIGGTRFFGRNLVETLLGAGHRVTIATRGRTRDDFGQRVERIRVDRRSRQAMADAFRAVDGFDIVYDQMCYSPLDAQIAAEVFAGRVDRYVMSSTIEVYSLLRGRLDHPFREDDIDLSRENIDLSFPWHAPELAEASYAIGKRQAEAFFHQDGSLPVVPVRIAHVLAGPEDFTGRLAAYVRQAAEAAPFRHSAYVGPTSFLAPQAIGDFLAWVGQQDFTGPVNAACEGMLTALEIHKRTCELLGMPTAAVPMHASAGPCEYSPFDFPFPYAMDTSRAASLGYRFGHIGNWLDDAIRAHAAALQPA